MTRKGCIWAWIVGIVGLLVIFLVTVIAIETILGQRISLPVPGARVGLVRIEGTLIDPSIIIEDLKAVERDAGVRSLVIRIESPGGGVSASQEIYDRIVKLRDNGLPVVVSMGSIAASGGYYVACPADTIVANPGTLTGSIGVIMSFAQFEELFRKIGMDIEVVKSGEYKDIGSMSREMTDGERALLQGTIDDLHDQFVETVSRERGLPIDDVRALADGRIFSGRQALEAGLVDTLGTLDDALALAGRMAGIEGEPRVWEPVKPGRLTLLDLLASSLVRAVTGTAPKPGAQYLYGPPSVLHKRI